MEPHKKKQKVCPVVHLLFFVGSPGSGKSTIAKELESTMGGTFVSSVFCEMSEIIETEKNSRSTLGQLLCDNHQKRIPDPPEISVALLLGKLRLPTTQDTLEAGNHLRLISGFPRNTAQWEAFMEELSTHRQAFHSHIVVTNLKIKKQVALSRMRGRSRENENPKKRLERYFGSVFPNYIRPLLDTIEKDAQEQRNGEDVSIHHVLAEKGIPDIVKDVVAFSFVSKVPNSGTTVTL